MNKQLSFNRLTSALVITIASSMLLASCGGSSAPASQPSKPVTVAPSKPSTGTTGGTTGNSNSSGSNSGSNGVTTTPEPTPTPEAQNKPQLPEKPTHNNLTLATGPVTGAKPVTDPTTQKGSSTVNQPQVTPQYPTPTFKQGQGSIVLATGVQVDNDATAKVSVKKASGTTTSDLNTELHYKWTPELYKSAFQNDRTVIYDDIPKNTSACVVYGYRCPQTSIEKVIDTNTAYDLYSKPSDQVGRVLLVGDEMTSVTTAGSTGRLERDYLNPATQQVVGKENDVVDQDAKDQLKFANQAEMAAYVMLGKPGNHAGNYKVAGLLSMYGKVKFLGHTQYQTSTLEQVYDLARSDQFAQAVKNNYKIVLFTKTPEAVTNESLKTFIKDNLNPNDSTKFDFDAKLRENGDDLIKTLNQVGYLDYRAIQYNLPTLSYYAKHHDVLFIVPTGEDYNGMSDLGLALQSSNPDLDLEALRKSIVFVSTYHPDDGITRIFDVKGARCGKYDKFYCVTAYDSMQAEFTEDVIKAQGGEYDSAQKTQVSTSSLNAAAQVAALAASVKSVFPFMTSSNLQTTIVSTAENLGDGITEEDGKGLVHPEIALNGPSQIYNGNFTADLSHNKQLFGNTKEFYFNNPIQGNGDLVVTGDDRNIRLVLTNNSGYTGNTLVKGEGHLEVRGRLDHSPTVDVDTNATLSGDGFVKNLYNRGTVSGYALNDIKYQNKLQFDHNSNEFKTQSYQVLEPRGLTVTGNFQQTETGTLSVLLGLPVIVYGTATLNGTLQIDGLSKGLLTTDDYVFGDVIVAKGAINGVFKQLSSNSPLVDVHAEGVAQIPHTYTTTSGKVNALILKAKYVSAATAMLQSNDFVAPVIRDIAFTGGQNIDRLYASVRSPAGVNLSGSEYALTLAEDAPTTVTDSSDVGAAVPTTTETTSSTVANGVENSATATSSATATTKSPATSNDSPLRSLMASLLDGNQDQVRATAQAFAGREFVDAVEQHQLLTRHALNSATQRLYDLRDLDHVTTGYGALNATQSYLGNSQGAASNLTTLAYEYQLQGQRWVAGVDVGSSNWKHTQATTADSKHRSYGVFAGATMALPQASDWGVSGLVSYHHHNTDLERQVQVATLAAQSFSDKITTSDLSATAALLKNWTWEQHSFQTYAGTTYNYGRWNGAQDGAVVESYPGFTLSVRPQNLSFWDAFVGGKYSYRNLFNFAGLQLDLDYKLSGELAAWQELQGELADSQYRVEQRYTRGNAGLTHQVSAQVSQQVNDNVTLQAQGALLHAGTTTYRLASLGLQVKF